MSRYQPTASRLGEPRHPLEDDPLWYKNAIIYQVHVRAFHDSDGDGIGDFRGLTQKLGYLQELGVTTLWLLPFYPSPLRDDGYDIADYTDVHPAYGTLRDFKDFIAEAHRFGLRVITELVLNHTSDQHPWFQRARRSKPGSQHRDFYVWSDTTERYRQARIIFKDFETSNWAWDEAAQAYYWHRFYSHQPDLNFDNPAVHRALTRVVDFWLNLGVDGLRLDAVPYLYQREGTSCENLPETHEFLKKLRAHVDEHHRNRMLLAEANQWPEDAIAYFGLPRGDECHMAFHFPLMPRLFMGMRMEDRFPIIDILQQTPAIPDNCQWAVFLRNHDELTLEMVTDEERDYMYRVYAADRQARINLGIRRRLAPLLNNNRRRIELMNGLLFSLGGTPIVYYGDEIGMGDNVYLGDRNGVRTPMQWSPDRNAGFSKANPQRLYLPIIIDPEYHFETVNVEAQMNNPSSILWWMRRLIALRKRYPVFGLGSLEFLHPENPKVLAFVRQDGEQSVLVVANLSRFVQCVELDLSRFKAMRPVELFGLTRFPPIGDLPYFLTLSPHGFYWFALEPTEKPAVLAAREQPHPVISVSGEWTNLFKGSGREQLEAALPQVLAARRWYGAKAKSIESVKLVEAVPRFSRDELPDEMPEDDGKPRTRRRTQAGAPAVASCLLLVEVSYFDAESEMYQIPVVFATGDRAEALLNDTPQAVLVRVEPRGTGRQSRDGEGADGVLIDAVYSRDWCLALLESITNRRRFKGEHGEVVASSALKMRGLRASPGPADGARSLEPALIKAEQSNTSIVFGDRHILKLFRRLSEGVNPDVEIGRFLTGSGGGARFPHIPPVEGFIDYRLARQEPRTLAVLQGYVVNEGDAWQYTLSALGAYFERVTTEDVGTVPAAAPLAMLDFAATAPTRQAVDAVGPYLQSAETIGRRTAEMHLALSSDDDDPTFAPEPITPHYQRSLYQSMRNTTRQAVRALRSRFASLDESAQELAQQMLDREEEVIDRFGRIREIAPPRAGQRIRTHGDYHLGQVLYTGKDFIIIDFEGEPARPLSERRMKRPPLRDVAGMLRSFDYAAHMALSDHRRRWGATQPEEIARLHAWAHFWRTNVSAAFLHAYFAALGETPIIPREPQPMMIMLDAFLLEKAIYELGYELNSRPEWAPIPLEGILNLLEAGSAPTPE